LPSTDQVIVGTTIYITHPVHTMKRGAFILFEGVDRCGKTTQARRLVDSLTARGQSTEFMRFPDRETAIGGQIDAYLRNAAELDDHAVHLLFSANRWEKRCVPSCWGAE
jgi:dTMP kinase